MDYFVKTIGMLILAIGAVTFVKPYLIRTLINFVKVDKRIFIGAGLRIFLGILLLLSLNTVSLPMIPGILGALMIINGILVFVLGMTKVHLFLDKVYYLDDKKIRILPILSGILGILLIYSV